MKKLVLTIAIVLGMAIGAFAQNNGLFGYGQSRADESYDSRTTLTGFALPGEHGVSGDVSANDTPVGSGVVLLIGLGAAYAMSKRRKE